MKPDIKNRKDIEKLINAFYEKVKTDQVIGYLFTDVAKLNWEKHLPIMYDFWENILFYTGNYTGNPMIKHKFLHEKSPLSTAHFQHWNKLFTENVDDLFEGDKAETIKQKALSISTILQINIFK